MYLKQDTVVFAQYPAFVAFTSFWAMIHVAMGKNATVRLPVVGAPLVGW